MQVIDITTIFPKRMADLAARYGTPNWPWINTPSRRKPTSWWEIDSSAIFIRRAGIRKFDCERWIVTDDLQIISATPVLFAYERPVEHALDCAQLFNDAALELCSREKAD